MQSVLLNAIKAKAGTDGIEDFTFNRFNVRSDFGAREAVINDDLNAAEEEVRLSLETLAARVAEGCPA